MSSALHRRLRTLDTVAAVHELTDQCANIVNACTAITNLYALTVKAGFNVDDLDKIVDMADALVKRAQAVHACTPAQDPDA